MHRDAIDHYQATLGPKGPIEDLEKRRLAGTGRAQYVNELARLHAQAESGEDRILTVTSGDVVELYRTRKPFHIHFPPRQAVALAARQFRRGQGSVCLCDYPPGTGTYHNPSQRPAAAKQR